MNSNDKLAESMRALADAWRQSDSPIAQVHAALLDGALAAAPAPSEPAPDHIPGVGGMVAARQPRQKEID